MELTRMAMARGVAKVAAARVVRAARADWLAVRRAGKWMKAVVKAGMAEAKAATVLVERAAAGRDDAVRAEEAKGAAARTPVDHVAVARTVVEMGLVAEAEAADEAAMMSWSRCSRRSERSTPSPSSSSCR